MLENSIYVELILNDLIRIPGRSRVFAASGVALSSTALTIYSLNPEKVGPWAHLQ